jgi:hypothetical protein
MTPASARSRRSVPACGRRTPLCSIPRESMSPRVRRFEQRWRGW